MAGQPSVDSGERDVNLLTQSLASLVDKDELTLVLGGRRAGWGLVWGAGTWSIVKYKRSSSGPLKT